MKVQLKKWYKPKIDKYILINKKSDLKGFLRGCFFIFLCFSGLLAFITWST